MGTDEHVCPACRQPVTTVVRRHKTLGAFVPVWGPGPCHNPECETYVGEPGAGTRAGSGGGAGPRAVPGRDTGEPREHPGESVAENEEAEGADS